MGVCKQKNVEAHCSNSQETNKLFNEICGLKLVMWHIVLCPDAMNLYAEICRR